MRDKRVVIYGGTKLDRKTSDFVTRVACELLKNERIVLAMGGFRRAADQPPNTTPTDVAAMTGAALFARKHRVPLKSCLEIRLPEPTKDRKTEGVERLPNGKVTVHGEVRTALVLEMALAIARPALPLAFTGRLCNALARESLVLPGAPGYHGRPGGFASS